MTTARSRTCLKSRSGPLVRPVNLGGCEATDAGLPFCVFAFAGCFGTGCGGSSERAASTVTGVHTVGAENHSAPAGDQAPFAALLARQARTPPPRHGAR